LKRGITYNRELWRWFRWGMYDGQVWGLHTIPGSSIAIRGLKMLGVVVPLFTLLALQQVATPRRAGRRRSKRGEDSSAHPVSWALFLLLLASLFAFVMGMLPVKPMVIATNSMYPAVVAGDVVILRQVDQDALKPGDVAAYHAEGFNIVHRIDSIDSVDGVKQFTFKGDNNPSPDAKAVAGDLIFGKVIYRIPYLGRLSLALKTIESPENVPVDTGS
jgi:signal peptidase I